MTNKKNYNELLSYFGKNSQRVEKRLSEIFNCNPDKLPYHLNQAWTRAASWEFYSIYKARINHRKWLIDWFADYSNVPDHGFDKALIEDSYENQYEKVRTAKLANAHVLKFKEQLAETERWRQELYKKKPFLKG